MVTVHRYLIIEYRDKARILRLRDATTALGELDESQIDKGILDHLAIGWYDITW